MTSLHICIGLAVSSVLTGCIDSEDGHSDLTPEPVASGKSDATCPSIAANIPTRGLAPLRCNRLDVVSELQMLDINTFWGSSATLCACGPDFPLACDGNAFALPGGWIYASGPWLGELRGGPSPLPASYILAHEFGHQLQNVHGRPPIMQLSELQADCYAGYYLGSLACRGGSSVTDVVATLVTACVIADGTGDPIADLTTHGTCQQRAESVALGMRGYHDGRSALDVCRLSE